MPSASVSTVGADWVDMFAVPTDKIYGIVNVVVSNPTANAGFIRLEDHITEPATQRQLINIYIDAHESKVIQLDADEYEVFELLKVYSNQDGINVSVSAKEKYGKYMTERDRD